MKPRSIAVGMRSSVIRSLIPLPPPPLGDHVWVLRIGMGDYELINSGRFCRRLVHP